MTKRQRQRLGVAGVVAGILMLATGIAVAHFSGLAGTNSVGGEIYPHVPRCAWFESGATCWVIPTSGQVLALVGSQVLLAAVIVGWIWKRPLTWSRATLAALLTTLEMIILFGIIPNQLLALAEDGFGWASRDQAFLLPKWLMLNNEVSISFGAVKSTLAAGYAALMLGFVVAAVYQILERPKRRIAPKPQRFSAYGRPLVEGK